MNHVILVGRLVRIPELRKTDTGRIITNITIAVGRPFKDINGEYQTDFINCTVWEAIAQRIVKYCKQGDLIGIKGRLQIIKEEDDDITKNIIQVITENLTMLSHPQIKLEEELALKSDTDIELDKKTKNENKKKKKEG